VNNLVPHSHMTIPATQMFYSTYSRVKCCSSASLELLNYLVEGVGFIRAVGAFPLQWMDLVQIHVFFLRFQTRLKSICYLFFRRPIVRCHSSPLYRKRPTTELAARELLVFSHDCMLKQTSLLLVFFPKRFWVLYMISSR